MSEIKYLLDRIETAAYAFNQHSDTRYADIEEFMRATADLLKIIIEDIEALKNKQKE